MGNLPPLSLSIASKEYVFVCTNENSSPLANVVIVIVFAFDLVFVSLFVKTKP